MKKLAFLSAIVLTMLTLNAQHQRVKIDPDVAVKAKIDFEPKKSTSILQSQPYEITHDSDGENWNRKIVKIAKKHPIPSDIKTIIKQKTEEKINNQQNYPPSTENEKGIDERPGIGVNFEANWFDGYTPPDNSLAISNNGNIVSVTNSTIEYYSHFGEFLYTSSFDNFFSDEELTSSIYDPEVLYDSGSDRFIMIVLHGSSYSTSRVLTCFSKTNNPMDGWWYYKLTGNPLDDNSWFDYPKIGISNNDLFVTGNLFSNSGIFQESVIYQINKNDGYNATNLDWMYWYNLTDGPFTLVPASYGQAGNYGPGIYLISTHYGDQEYKLYEVTDDIDHDPSLNIYRVEAEFSLSGDALQYGTSVVLDGGGPRALSAFYLNGYIHFVFHSEREDGFSGINYNRLKINSLTNTSSIYGLEGFDYNYPSVASYGTNQNDKSVMICFLRASSNIYPEVRVVGLDNIGNWTYSTLVKEGETYVDISQEDGVTRWGDYTGISRKQNSVSPEVWVSGGFGATTLLIYHAFDTWIAQVTEFYVGEKEFVKESKNNLNVYPNPIINKFNIEFDLDVSSFINLELTDINGNPIKNLYGDYTRAATYRFSFNKDVLPAGIYILKLTSNKTTIAREKVVVL